MPYWGPSKSFGASAAENKNIKHLSFASRLPANRWRRSDLVENRFLSPTNRAAWSTFNFFSFSFSCSWKDVPDHQVHVWQLWQHVSGKCLPVRVCACVRARVCVCWSRPPPCTSIVIPINTTLLMQTQLFASTYNHKIKPAAALLLSKLKKNLKEKNPRTCSNKKRINHKSLAAISASFPWDGGSLRGCVVVWLWRQWED